MGVSGVSWGEEGGGIMGLHPPKITRLPTKKSLLKFTIQKYVRLPCKKREVMGNNEEVMGSKREFLQWAPKH